MHRYFYTFCRRICTHCESDMMQRCFNMISDVGQQHILYAPYACNSPRMPFCVSAEFQRAYGVPKQCHLLHTTSIHPAMLCFAGAAGGHSVAAGLTQVPAFSHQVPWLAKVVSEI